MTIVNCGVENTIRLIDVLWLAPEQEAVAAAFEIEHSTSIIVRTLDLALGLPDYLSGSVLPGYIRRSRGGATHPVCAAGIQPGFGAGPVLPAV